MAYKLTDDDLHRHLRDARDALRGLSEVYDAGQTWAAKQLATVVRVLVHDTGSSSSLLGQLGAKDSLRWVDTAGKIDPRNLAPTWGLVRIHYRTDVGARWDAPLNDRPSGFRGLPRLPFETWWTTPVTKSGDGAVFSRRDYVLRVANKDGGAHVDSALPEDWAAITRGASMAVTYTISGDPEERLLSDDPTLPALRQIAHEVMTTLDTPEGPIGRNDPCICGSGRKFKKCCGV